MDNISSQIGALELGEHVAGHDDDVLEAAETGPNTTVYCTMRGPGGCATDGALEAAGATAIAPATNNVPMTLCCR
jgi:hypothetical protein